MQNIKLKLYVLLARFLLKVIYLSNQWNVRGRDNYQSLIENNKPVIFAVWHGQLLSISFDLSQKHFHAIAGTHKDAELIAQIMTSWGWKMHRGSSKEKGHVAYKAMLQTLKRDKISIAITPDGPTGPARIPKPGVIRAAQSTGAQIIPVGVFSTKKWGFTNWDTFYLEKPFGQIYVTYGTPIKFKKTMDLDTCKKHFLDKMKETEENNLHYANNKY
jgi:hypothetical protein